MNAARPSRTVLFSGVVTQGGVPYPGRRIRVAEVTSTTGRDGAFAIDVNPGEHTLQVDGLDRFTSVIDLTEGSVTRNLSLPAPVDHRIAIVTADGAPVADAYVYVHGQRTVYLLAAGLGATAYPSEAGYTDRNGIATIALYPDANASVHVKADGHPGLTVPTGPMKISTKVIIDTGQVIAS